MSLERNGLQAAQLLGSILEKKSNHHLKAIDAFSHGIDYGSVVLGACRRSFDPRKAGARSVVRPGVSRR